MSHQDEEARDELVAWRVRWEDDLAGSSPGQRGFFARVAANLQRLVRSLRSDPHAQRWNQQKAFNLSLLDAIGRSVGMRSDSLTSAASVGIQS